VARTIRNLPSNVNPRAHLCESGQNVIATVIDWPIDWVGVEARGAAMTTAEDLASDLTGVVARGEIEAFYQPQVDIQSRKPVAVEVLARWAHPKFGLVPPNLFIPLAEAFTVIHEIGDFMLETGIRQAAEWRGAGLDLSVAINVSPVQLSDLSFLDGLQEKVEAAGLPLDAIVIEVTESQPVVLVETVTNQLHDMRERGLGISIDDVGTGYSSFAQLAGIPATEIKIDKSLIQDPGPAEAIIQGIIDDAHAEALRVVAEGVESEEHLATALLLKCDRAQGYLFGRPTPAKLLTPQLLESARRL
jgi:EAL domain-containing protein (putative c-di-GMP-specific phosphodiesterase class I)